MKNNVCLYLCVCISICLLFSSCYVSNSEPAIQADSNEEQNVQHSSCLCESEDNIDVNISSVQDVDDMSLDATYSYSCNPYYLLPDNDPFIVAMKENPIDKYADEVMENVETTNDMMSGLYLVFQKWEAELYATEAQLKECIEDNTLEEALIMAQENWLEYVNTSLVCDKNLIEKNGSSTDISLMFLSRRIELYRERTIHLKYLMYLYSADLNDGAFEEAMRFLTV